MSLCRTPGCTTETGKTTHCLPHRVSIARTNTLTTKNYEHPHQLRTYLTAWTARGRRITTLAGIAGVDPRVLLNIHAGITHHVRPGITQAVLAVPPPPSDVGCARRLHALAVRGYTLQHIATSINTTKSALAKALTAQKFADHTAYKIAHYYNQNLLRPGPSKLMTRRALQNGYQHPIAWHQRDIDDPKTKPNPIRLGPEPLTLDNAWPRALALQGLSTAWLRTQGLHVREAA
jgi:hypothetical protein